MNDDYTIELDLEESAEFCRESYWAGVGAALAGETLPQAIQAARESGCPFGPEEEAAMKDGFQDATNYRRDKAAGNDHPRAA